MAFCPSQPLYIMKGSKPFAEIELAPHEVYSASAVLAVRPWPLPSAGVSIYISQQLRPRPRQSRGRRPGCRGDGARFSKEARLYLWDNARVVGVGLV